MHVQGLKSILELVEYQFVLFPRYKQGIHVLKLKDMASTTPNVISLLLTCFLQIAITAFVVLQHR